eukprot:m.54326 g.54326  ORF g.54326 m.54326 type:complete len:92 (+) comp7714_c2_seq4:891-1166(+)
MSEKSEKSILLAKKRLRTPETKQYEKPTPSDDTKNEGGDVDRQKQGKRRKQTEGDDDDEEREVDQEYQDQEGGPDESKSWGWVCGWSFLHE